MATLRCQKCCAVCGRNSTCWEIPTFLCVLIWNWKKLHCSVYNMEGLPCNCYVFPFLSQHALQIAHGWSSLRCSYCCRLSSTCSCPLGSSAHRGARTSCWRAPQPTALLLGMQAKTCARKGWLSPPARQHT